MIDQALRSRKMIVTCGTGGVGKTTVSAALGLRAAMLGKRVLVITVDPAKRLATALGLGSLSSTPTDLTDRLPPLKNSGGRFSALIPDHRDSFLSFFRSLTTKPEVLDRLVKNPILEMFSRDYSGANEYLALEELYRATENESFDLVILDTPPSRHTRSFLEAPRTLARLFEEKWMRWLVMPAQGWFAGGAKKALGVLEKLTGGGL